MAPSLLARFPSFLPHAGTLYHCIMLMVLVSCAVLLAFQVKLAAHRETAVPPWMRQPVPSELRNNQARGGQQDGRESRTERAQRIMERQIFRDDDAADHRHDGSVDVSLPARRQLPWFFKNGTEWPRPSSKLSRVAGVWPDPGAPHDDRIVAQLMYLPPGYKAGPKSANTSLKTIVLDGSWYDFVDGQTLFLRDRCPVDRCRVYRRRAPEGVKVDATIVKDGYSSYYRPTGEKGRNQGLRILYLLENPMNGPLEEGGALGIDWTATYRKDSDIVTPYEKFVLFDPLVKAIRRDHDYTRNKSKMVAWFVSNCHTENNRLHYAHKLQEHIQVDIYGNCGSLTCSRYETEMCYQMVERDYYFYLAFENANCKDYITEKFFNALRHNVVPVVMGASREEYRAAAPHHSYIHVEDFRSPKELAEYLLVLSRNRTLYNEYFRWKGTGEFVNTYFWCRLCALLHAPPRPHKRRSEDVYRWWHTGACRAGYEPPLPPAIALASRRRA